MTTHVEFERVGVTFANIDQESRLTGRVSFTNKVVKADAALNGFDISNDQARALYHQVIDIGKITPRPSPNSNQVDVELRFLLDANPGAANEFSGKIDLLVIAEVEDRV